MSAEKNKEIVRNFYNLINEKKYDELEPYFHPNFKFYSQVERPLTAAEFVEQERGHMDAFDGHMFRIRELVAEGDKVAVYLTAEGVHARPFAGLDATGKKVFFSLMFLITLKEGKFYEKRAHYDGADILRQLGVDCLCPSMR